MRFGVQLRRSDEDAQVTANDVRGSESNCRLPGVWNSSSLNNDAKELGSFSLPCFSITAHERGEQRLLIPSDGRSLDRCDPSERGMTTRPGEQSGDVGPAIVVLSV
jgi:hypothetical protein